MSKFNLKSRRPAASGPIVADRTRTTATYEGAPAHVRDARSELFLLAVSNMVGEDTFYEKAGDRDARFADLVGKVAVADGRWMLGFLGWLRGEANMRSAPLVGAAHAVRARLDATPPPQDDVTNRSLVNAVLQRADEPGEFLAYWTSRFGRALPKPVKRGVADAVVRLYNGRSLVKYDSDSAGFRFGDVVDLVHPGAQAPWQGDLFAYALDRRHGRDSEPPASIPVLAARSRLMALPVGERRAFLARPDAAQRLSEAGMTWEAFAGWLQGPMDAAAWAAVLPSMGYMARLRNLRNFDQAGLGDDLAAGVAGRLADPAEVARSRQFPFRFLAAYQQAPSLRWGHALDRALQSSLRNVPALPGRTLVLVDTSASMSSGGWSKRSTMSPVKAAAVFGVALAAKGERVDLHGFADGVFTHPVRRGASVVREVDRFCSRVGEVGHGTNVAASIRATYRGHDRVFVISDMQTMDAGVSAAVPADVALYGFNLGGYRPAAFAAGTGRRHEFGGLTDATFRMVPLLEAGRDATWPWL